MSGLTERERLELLATEGTTWGDVFAAVERIVADRERAAQVRALREAADAVEHEAIGPAVPGNGAMDAGIFHSAIWLRGRADRIEGGDPT
jgi:hypothetical protein